MDSPQHKALASMDGSKTPHLLPVTLAKNTPRPDLVRWVSAWALFTTCVFAFSFAVAYAPYLFHVPCSQSSFFLRCDQLTDAEETVANALGIVMVCYIALQAAAAVLALRLPCSRRWVRRTLAYLALALTIGGHFFYAAIAHLLLVADPGDLFFGINFAVSIVFFAVGDIISFLSLLLGGEDEE